MAAIFQADIWCDDCAECIKNRFYEGRGIHERELTRDEWEEREGLDDERNYDSDEYPKYCSDDEESDCPQHCAGGADCVNAVECSDGSKYGYFFGNALTSDGDDYVKEAVNEDRRAGRTDSPACELWAPCYDYIDFHEQCVVCGSYADLDHNDECDDCAGISDFCADND